MLSKQNSRKKAAGPSGNNGRKFLTDLDTMTSAFYAPSRLTSSTASSRSKSVSKTPAQEPKKKPDDPKPRAKPLLDQDKKPSIWSWKGLRALTQARHRRFNCTFSLTVHSVVGLPLSLEGSCLVVHWRRRDADWPTRPARVSRGSAAFGDERLTHSCSVYGSKSGPHNSAKYEARQFLLYVSILGSPEVDLGRHRVDLTRLLPLKLEELEEEDKCSGKWTTSFRLSGRASGATVNVSFGYDVAENVSCGEQSGKMDDGSEDVKELHEVLPVMSSELCDSVNVLYQKLDDEACDDSVGNKVEEDDCLVSSSFDRHGVELLLAADDDGERACGNECEIDEFSVVDKGTVESTEENVIHEDESRRDGLEADLAIKVVAPDEEGSPRNLSVLQNDEQLENIKNNVKREQAEVFSKESLMKDLEAALSCATDLANEVDSQDESDYGDCKMGKSPSLDDVTEAVANDFLEMLGIEHDGPIISESECEPESPRERLLREFEMDSLSNGGLLNFLDFESSSLFEDSVHMPDTENNAFVTKPSASMMEDLETEALMREWGLDEHAFQHSSSFGSPIHVDPPEDTQPLPPLAEGVGPFVRTENGGFVRSMSPALFENSKNGGSLIMQVSSPVVVPAEMGSGVMDILQGLASVGIEKLSMQANKLMPLEDITGKTIEQIAWQSAQSLEGPRRQDLQPDEFGISKNTRNERKGAHGKSHVPNSSKSHSSLASIDSEYVSLEDLAPLAMDKIEALSIEGLRIQSGMSDQGSAPNITTQSIGEFSALKGKTAGLDGPIGLDGTCGLQLMDIKDDGQAQEGPDGLMGLSLTLDEWMKLDSGEIDENELASERTSKILAAHHATSLEAFRGRSRGDKRRGRARKYGLLGNNFTVALMVQLRDPLRNYEAVGAPMLALVQVERVFVPPKPKIHGTVCMVRDFVEKEEEDDDDENVVEKKTKDEVREEEVVIPEYKITEVSVAGLKAEEGSKKKLWGSSVNQQQTGSRWLLASGMGKKNSKNQVMKSKSSGDALWSISSRARKSLK
ncbi:ATP synthase subunit b [Striga asiatica]|uniref:ATP synthase subunit b n=1 Tax=Striga asiatica TaxID=4170 RepID=A0A5A7RKF2_STRAF|nr:ATP synthase subunit b [Striga asiatica]